jgi:deoxyribonuclease-4
VRFGFHISIEGGFENVVERAKYLGCETLQVFTASNKQWRRTPLQQDKVERFRAQRIKASLEPLVVHLFYLPNLATPDTKMRRRSCRALRAELERSQTLGAEFLVLHPGAFKKSDADQGIERVIGSLNQVISSANGNDVKILLENTAGGGTRLGASLEELGAIISGVKNREAIRVCLDTAHAFQAGYPIHTKEGLEETLDEFDRLIGLSRLCLLHLNDSKTPFASRNDRHWHIGEGEMGMEAFERIINHPRLKHLPAIMETPTAEKDNLKNMATVKRLREKN